MGLGLAQHELRKALSSTEPDAALEMATQLLPQKRLPSEQR
jgi:hypothetical protein